MITDFEDFDIHKVQPCWLEAKLTEKHINFLWECIDHRKKEKYKNLVGNLHGSYLLDNKEYDQIFFTNIISNFISEWIKINGSSIFTDQYKSLADHFNMMPVLNDWWVNFQHEGDFNPIHDHGGLFSFVIWMKIPTHWKDQEKLARCVDSRTPMASNFQFIYTDALGKIESYTYRMSPEKEGTMLFFPAKLKHQVYPFYDCKEERISISGNISMKPVNLEMYK
jgi:hypothetical protein|tara:strand:- start:42 stop:710 length:669 start_codon:yes stop_codon:yes gene_type:complete